MTAVLETSGLCVGWEKQPILKGINLSVAAGERLALLGENGSGKTTLLRVLAGLMDPLAGTIRWNGGPIARGSERVRMLGVLMQNESASRFTVRELVTLGLSLDEPMNADTTRTVDSALIWGELDRLASRRCTTLSGGESQRAMLTRSLVAGPKLLLLDEPTNHLDPARQASLLARLEQLRGDISIILATHDLTLAASCDRVALIHAGGIDSIGTPDEILTPIHLARTMGVHVHRLDDPEGGPPFIRVATVCARGAVA